MAESATGGDSSINDKGNEESVEDKSWEVIDNNEIASDENKDITQEGSGINQKEQNGSHLSSPIIKSLLSIGNGHYQMQMVEGKIYVLPFHFTMKPEVKISGRFQYLKQNNVWYKLKRDDSGSLFIQNKETGALTRLNESSEDLMDGDRLISNTSTSLVKTATYIDNPAGGKRVEAAIGKECTRHENKKHKATEHVFGEKPDVMTDSKENRNVSQISSEKDKHESERDLEEIPTKDISKSDCMSSKYSRETDDTFDRQTGQQAGRKSDEENDSVHIPGENSKQKSELNASETGYSHRLTHPSCRHGIAHVNLYQTGGEERNQETEKHHKKKQNMIVAELTSDGGEEQKPAIDNLHLLHKGDSDQGSGDEKDKYIIELRNGKFTSMKHQIQNIRDNAMEGKVDEAVSESETAKLDSTYVELEELKHCSGTSSKVLSGGTVVGASSGQEANHTCNSDERTSEPGQSEKLKEKGHLDLKRNAICEIQDMENKLKKNKDDTSEGQKYGQSLIQRPNEINNADMDMLEKSEDQTPQGGEGDKQIISEASKEGEMKTDTSLQAACAKMGKKKLDILIRYRKTSGAQFVKKMIKLSCTEDFLCYWNFHTKTSVGKQMLDVIVSDHQCSVAVSNEVEDLFIVEVIDQCFKQESDIKEFIKMVINSVYQKAQKLLCLCCFSVEVVIQDDFLQEVKQRKEMDAFWIAKAGEHNSRAMYAVSREENKELMTGKITEIIDIAWKCFENHEEKVPADNIWERVMEKFGYIEEMKGKFLKTKIIYNEKLNAYVLKGVRNETKAAAEHLEKLLKTAHVEVHGEDFSLGCQFEIFTNPELCDYIDSMIQHIPTPFVWIPIHHTQKLHIFCRTPECINRIYTSIVSCVQEKGCPLSRDMVSLEEFKSIEELRKKHKGKVFIQPSDKSLLVTAASDIFESVYAALQDICSQKNVTAEVGSNEMTPDHKTDHDSIRSKELLSKKGHEISKCIEVHDRQFFKTLVKEDLFQFEHLANERDVTICKIKKANRFGFELRGSEADVMLIFNNLSEKIKSKEQKLQHDDDIPAENVKAQMEASSPNAANIPSETDEAPPLPLSSQQGNENQSPAVVEDEEHQGGDNNDIPPETDEAPPLPLSSQQGKENQSLAVVEVEEHQGEGNNGEQNKHGKQHSGWIYPNNKVLVLLKVSTCNADVVIIPEIDKIVSTSNSKDMAGRLSVPLWDKGEKEKHILSNKIKTLLMGVSGKSVGFCINPVGGWDFKHYLKCFLFEIDMVYTGSSVNNSVECLFLFTSEEVLYHAACDITQHYLKDKARQFSTDACDYKHLHTVQEEPVFKIIKVSLYKGCLHDAQTEVLVNTISTDLDLKKGAISASLLKKAGPGLQKQISHACQPPAVYGIILKTSACLLPSSCKAIYHGALKKHNPMDDSTMLLQQFVLNCLHQASESKYKSIAFPAIGTGNLNFPKDMVSGLMLTAIIKFEQSMPKTSLREVKFVIFPTDTETYQAFEKQLNDLQSMKHTVQTKHSNVMPAISKTLQYGQVQVQAKLGTFENESQDCLLVFRDKQLMYNISNKKILHSAGSKVAQEFEEHRNKHLFSKDVILVTCGGILKYTKIIHVGCDINTINRAAGAGLMRADSESMKTVVVPVLADDPFQRDVNKYCTGILRAVKEMATSLKFVQSVMFVIQGQNNFTFYNEVFEQESKLYGTGKSTGAETVIKHPVSGAKSGESQKSVQSEPVAQNMSRNEEEAQPQLCLDPVITLEGNTIQLALTDEEKCCIILSGDIKRKEDLKEILSNYTNKIKHIVWPYEETSALIIFEKEVDVQKLELITKPFKVEPLQPQVLQNCECCLVDDLVKRVRSTGHVKELITSLEEVGGVVIKEKDDHLFICAVTVHQMDIAKVCLENFCETRLNIKIRKHSKCNTSTTKYEESYNNIEKIDLVSEVEFMALNKKGFEMSKVEISWDKSGTIVIEGPPEFATRVKTNLNSQLGALRNKQSEEILLDDDEKNIVKDCIEEVLFKDTICVYDEKKSQVVVYSENHADILTFKHRLKVKAGKLKETGKRGNRFAVCSQPAEEAQEDFSSSVKLGSGRRKFSWSTDSSDKEVFHTKENITVAVYTADILNLPVDCIVNAANDRMQHGGGVAKVIADAAGLDLVQEGDAIISKMGNIAVGCQVTTTAGRLHYRCVIHTVGPRWSDYQPHDLKKVKECEEDLYKAIYGCFLEAEKKELSTIALPAISSGIFAVPQEMCAVQYAKAVLDYSRKSVNGMSLKEIHFIDKLPSLVKLIQDTFRTMIQNGKVPNYNVHDFVVASTSYQRRKDGQEKGASAANNSQHKASKRKELSPLYYDLQEHHTNHFVFQVSEKPVVHIYEGNILNLTKIDALVCADDSRGTGYGKIALELKNRSKHKQQKDKEFKIQKPTLGDVVITFGEDSHFKTVVYVVIENKNQNQSDFKSMMIKSFDNILRQTNKWVKVKTIAMPLLGMGYGILSEKSWAELFLGRFVAFCLEVQNPNLEEVHIVLYHNSSSVFSTLKTVICDFVDQANKGQPRKMSAPPRPPPPKEHILNKGNGSKNDKGEENENCTICMCPQSDPKSLSCGHSFCSDCMDQMLKHKPVCPVCGKIVGTLTGDQPEDGRMNIRTSLIDLAGYRGYGSIVITYDFPSGRQGPNHPSPGTWYGPLIRTAYLPNTPEGNKVCKMLKLAFDRKLVFTISQSRTTGKEGLTWNDIHHKTNSSPGTQFGYPDPEYLSRVKDELAAKGITEADV